MKKLLFLLVTALCVSSMAGCKVFDRNVPTNTIIKVGLDLPMSGPAAALGQSMRMAAEMSYDALPADVRSQIQLIFEDNQSVPANAVSDFQKLTDIDRIDALVTTTAPLSNAVSPLAEQKKLVMVAIALDPKIVQDKSYVVKHLATSDSYVGALVPEIKKRGYQKIAAAITQSASFVDLMDVFKKSIKEAGMENLFVIEEWFNPDIRDFRTFIVKTKEKQVDAVMITMLGPGQVGIFARQARELGLEVPLFASDFIENEDELKASGGALEGQWYVAAEEASSEFNDEYIRKYGSSPAHAAANAYDVIQIIGESVEKYGTDPEKLNWYLHNLKDFHGVVGTYSASGKNDFTLPAEIKIIEGGEFKRLYPR